VIGTFKTREFDSRADFEAGRVSRLHVCHNRLTDAGLEWMWKMMTGLLRAGDGTTTDHLGAARIVVGDGGLEFDRRQTRLQGGDTAQAPLDSGFPRFDPLMIEGEVTGLSAVFQSTFGERDAAFEWRERGLVSAQGVLIDRAVADQGRKVLGAIWQTEVILDLARS
jgi:hypothetical protein